MIEAPEVDEGKVETTGTEVETAPVPDPVPLPEAETEAVAFVARLAFWT